MATSLALSAGLIFSMLLATSPGKEELRYPDIVQETDDEDAYSVYVVPMRGQVGTDIRKEAFDDIISNIKEVKPDLVILHIDSHDQKNVDDEVRDIMEDTGQIGREDISYPSLIPLQELRQTFVDEVGDIPQIAYVEDAFSCASLLALSWEDMYIDRDADFGGAFTVWAYQAAGVLKDRQKYGKYLETIMGDVRGLVQYGGWDHVDRANLIQAMVVPTELASMSWRGREAVWYRDGKGEYPVDQVRDIPKGGLEGLVAATVNLNGEQAEQLLIADGVASPDRFIKDILAQRGHRRFRRVGKDYTDRIEKYRSDWRKAAERARNSFMEFMRKQNGELMFQLTDARKALKRYISAVKSNPAVRTRMQLEGFEVRELPLQLMLEALERRIQNGNTGGGGGGGGGGLGGGGF